TCVRFTACGPTRSPRKELITRLPPIMLPHSATVSDDETHWAYLVEDREGVRMVRGGVTDASGPPASVESENFRSASNRSFFPGTNRHVYWARGFDDQALLVVDDFIAPIGYSRHEYVVFDPTGRHWAAVASPPEDKTKALIFRDGQAFGPFVDACVPAWSPSGQLAYVRVPEGSVVTRRTELVVDDAVVRTHTGMPATCVPAFGEPFEGPELPRQAAVHYLTDGRLVSLMPSETNWALRRDDEVLGTFDASAPTSPASVGPYALAGHDACQQGSVIAATTVTPAKHAPVIAWWERPARSQHWRVMVDGRPALSPPCLRPWPHQPPVMTGDGRIVSFPCSVRFDDKGEAITIVHGLRQYGPYPEVWALALSDDGKQLAYGASNGSLDQGWAVYVDGVQRSERYYAIWRPRFDPSGRHLAWEAIRTVEGPNVLVLDGRTLATFDDLLRGPIFDRPGEVAWIVRRGNRLVRLNFPLTP
ncbi:MAG TPA: hypothetical protein VNO26_08035, partial [Candidatus Limnocylindria bacterium]|nr:hypothetical protein [Candidatus Limnocylindria bacterium]